MMRRWQGYATLRAPEGNTVLTRDMPFGSARRTTTARLTVKPQLPSVVPWLMTLREQ